MEVRLWTPWLSRAGPPAPGYANPAAPSVGPCPGLGPSRRALPVRETETPGLKHSWVLVMNGGDRCLGRGAEASWSCAV